MSYKSVKSPLLYDTPAPMSQATLTVSGNLLHISGQTAQDVTGASVAEGDIEGQISQVLNNIKALAEEAGGAVSDVCRIVVYLTAREYFPKLMEARRQFFAEPYPATTAVIVAGLAKPEWLVEIEATVAIS